MMRKSSGRTQTVRRRAGAKAEAEAKGVAVLSEFHTWGPDEEE